MEKSCALPWQDLNLQSPVSKTDALSTHNVKQAAIFVSLHCTLSTVYGHSFYHKKVFLFNFMLIYATRPLRIFNNFSEHGFDPLPARQQQK